jgi:hypothetical protein
MHRLLVSVVVTVVLFLAGGCMATDVNRSVPQVETVALPALMLGDHRPDDAVNTGALEMVSPAQLQPRWVWQFGGVEYILGVDNENLVQYIATRSNRVRTDEGVSVGQAFAEVEKQSSVSVTSWPGWGYVAELPSGWNAAFFVGETMTDFPPRPTDKVAILFRGTAAGYGASRASHRDK